jgi:uncharacterized protein (DUF736 family)
MAEFVRKEMTGTLFGNKFKESENQPDVTGDCLIDGKKWKIAGWKNAKEGGKSYISLKFSDPNDYKPKADAVHVPVETDLPI